MMSFLRNEVKDMWDVGFVTMGTWTATDSDADFGADAVAEDAFLSKLPPMSRNAWLAAKYTSAFAVSVAVTAVVGVHFVAALVAPCVSSQ